MAAPKMDSMLLSTIVTATIAIGMMMNVITTEATWCVARSGCSNAALLSNLNWACGHGADCGPIQPGGSCFNPNTIPNHASYAFDSYYQRRGRAPGTCYFGGCAAIAVTDPSFGRCIYPPLESAAGEANTSSITNNPSMNNTKSEKRMGGDARNKLAQTLPVRDAQKP